MPWPSAADPGDRSAAPALPGAGASAAGEVRVAHAASRAARAVSPGARGVCRGGGVPRPRVASARADRSAARPRRGRSAVEARSRGRRDPRRREASAAATRRAAVHRSARRAGLRRRPSGVLPGRAGSPLPAGRRADPSRRGARCARRPIEARRFRIAEASARRRAAAPGTPRSSGPDRRRSLAWAEPTEEVRPGVPEWSFPHDPRVRSPGRDPRRHRRRPGSRSTVPAPRSRRRRAPRRRQGGRDGPPGAAAREPPPRAGRRPPGADRGASQRLRDR